MLRQIRGFFCVLWSVLPAILLNGAVLAQTGAGPIATSGQSADQSSYIPHRVYDSRQKRFSDLEMMLLDLARQDVVFVGEQHDDPATHRLERAILEGLARRRSNILVSLEMFERDSQSLLDNYLANRISEQEFLKASRPWPRYQTDYRPLVEFAKSRQWSVLAANIPRKYAARISREGLATIDQLPPGERQLVAEALHCPFDGYYDRFAEVMNSHPVATSGRESGEAKSAEAKKEIDARRREMTERFYFAQCAKDETMAESIVRRFDPPALRPGPLVVHFNGAFHSDYGLGTAERVKRRLRGSGTKVVSIIPLESLDQVDHDKYRKRGDYILFTLVSK